MNSLAVRDVDSPTSSGTMMSVLSRGLRLFLLLAVLVQYTPLRVCALESLATGSSCHDRGTHAVLGEVRQDEHAPLSSNGGEHDCICEQPKVDGQHDPQGVKSPV